MKTKQTKESRNFLIALLIGDGSISSNNAFKLSHGHKQKEYLEWKISRLKELGIRNSGLKSYIKKCGYTSGDTVYYTHINITPFTKALKRILYKPKKDYSNIRLLNRLTVEGLAIWFMDDGYINTTYKQGTDDVKAFNVRISTCVTKEQAEVIIQFFKLKWGITFRPFKEGNGYSVLCNTEESKKFLKLVAPTIEKIPSMSYKLIIDKRAAYKAV